MSRIVYDNGREEIKMEDKREESSWPDFATLCLPESQISPEVALADSRVSSLVVLQGAITIAKGYQSNLLDNLYQALVFQSEELEVYRVMEVYLRRGTIDKEKLDELLAKLEAGRKKLGEWMKEEGVKQNATN